MSTEARRRSPATMTSNAMTNLSFATSIFAVWGMVLLSNWGRLLGTPKGAGGGGEGGGKEYFEGEPIGVEIPTSQTRAAKRGPNRKTSLCNGDFPRPRVKNYDRRVEASHGRGPEDFGENIHLHVQAWCPSR
jgi:hypothetical protein